MATIFMTAARIEAAIGRVVTSEDFHRVTSFLRSEEWEVVEGEGTDTFAGPKDKEGFAADWDWFRANQEQVLGPRQVHTCVDEAPAPTIEIKNQHSGEVLTPEEVERIHQVLATPGGLIPVRPVGSVQAVDAGLLRLMLLCVLTSEFPYRNVRAGEFIRLGFFGLKCIDAVGDQCVFHIPTWEDFLPHASGDDGCDGDYCRVCAELTARKERKES